MTTFETWNCAAADVHMAHYEVQIASQNPKISAFQEVHVDIVKTLSKTYPNNVETVQKWSYKRDHTACCGPDAKPKILGKCKRYDSVLETAETALVLTWSEKHWKKTDTQVPSYLLKKYAADEFGCKTTNFVLIAPIDDEKSLPIAVINVHFQVPPVSGVHKKTQKIVKLLLADKDEMLRSGKVSKVVFLGDFNTTLDHIGDLGLERQSHFCDEPTNLCEKTGNLLRLDYIFVFPEMDFIGQEVVLPRESMTDHSQLRVVM